MTGNMVPDEGLLVSWFDIEDDGRCFEYTRAGAMLAYLDVYADGAVVTVFKPYEGHSRRYSKRSKRAAEGILDRHLQGQGYPRGSLDAQER